MRARPAVAVPAVIAVLAGACTACTGVTTEADPVDRVLDESLEPMSGIPEPPGAATTPEAVSPAAATTSPAEVALIGEHGHLGPVRDGRVLDTWLKWTALPSPDRSVAVMTIQPEQGRTIDSTPLAWAALPGGDETDELVIDGVALEADAVSQHGDFVALTNFADEPVGDQIAGAKEATTLVIASRDGVEYETGLDGNFVAEAFGRRTGARGVPAQVFLLEYFPAQDPTFYRVRVLSTETGEISLPLNLRNKQEQVDERMAGFSRSQVVADEHGLLFTLYRGTIDGTPDGEPYAFVHTLDFADGVWCLDVDPSLELERLAGSLAVGGDRLYVASANGRIGSFPIPSITDPDRSPTMDWTTAVGPAVDRAPVLLADGKGVWVAPGDDAVRLPDSSSRIVRVGSDGRIDDRVAMPAPAPSAMAYGDAGRLLAIGEGWSTFGEVRSPGWLGVPVAIVAG